MLEVQLYINGEDKLEIKKNTYILITKTSLIFNISNEQSLVKRPEWLSNFIFP